MQLTAVLATLTKTAMSLNDVSGRFLPASTASSRVLTNYPLLFSDPFSFALTQIVSNHLLLVAPEGGGREERGGGMGPGGRSSRKMGMGMAGGGGRASTKFAGHENANPDWARWQ